jgi:hypothetical protein
MGVIDKAIDYHIGLYGKPNPNVLAAQIDRNVLKSKIEDIFKEMTDNLNVGPLWLDKSGNADMIRSIPTLRRLWPESVFIFAKRRAIENVISRVMKFPAHNFEFHCADWAKIMVAWRKVREKLPSEVYLEIDQQDLIRYTEATSSKLLAFLELEHEKLETLVDMFTSKRPQETTEGSALKTYSLDSVGWSEAELAIFKKHCASEMEAYGYGSGSEYDLRR